MALSLHELVAARPLSHRPPLKLRFWIYSSVAYLTPVVLQIMFPADTGFADELVWLITLVPAFLLSLHYGLRGALAGLVMGTVLFAVVQSVVAMNFTPDDWQITTPIYIAYATLAISVGWLSEELHKFYQRALKSERMAAIGQASTAIRHQLSDALTVIAAQCEIVNSNTGALSTEQVTALRIIFDSALESADTLQQLTNLNAEPAAVDDRTGIAALAREIG